MSDCKHPTVIAGVKCLQCEIERLKEEVKGLEQTAEICRTDRDNALKRMHQKVISSHKRGNEFLKEFCPDLALTAESWHKFYKMWREGVQPLIDERDRYRKALERIAQEAEYLDGNGRQCGDIAMDALEEV